MRRRKPRTKPKPKTPVKRPNKRGYITLNVTVEGDDVFEQTDYGVVMGKGDNVHKMSISKKTATEILQMFCDELDYDDAEVFIEKFDNQ